MKKVQLKKSLSVLAAMLVLAGAAVPAVPAAAKGAVITAAAASSAAITYMPNGGEGEAVVQTHVSGAAVTLKAADTFVRDGYRFTGWNSKADGSGNTYEAGKTVSWQNDVTLYAVWAKLSSVTYKANGGTGADYVQYYDPDNAGTLVDPGYSREGYRFTGWNTKADGSGAHYAIHDEEYLWIKEGDSVLYAEWAFRGNTISYYGNGHDFKNYPDGWDNENRYPFVQSYITGESFQLQGELFGRYNYCFTGWNTEKDGSGTAYKAGQEVTWTTDEAVDLYAQWAEELYCDYCANDGSGKDELTVFVAGETKVADASWFERDGYIITSWNTKADGSGESYEPLQKVCWTANIALYAQWEPASSILYNANDGSGNAEVQTHVKGAKTALKDADLFTRSGYTLTWNTKADGTGNTYEPGQEVAWQNDVTLYAKWAPTKTITYVANGGRGAAIVQKHGKGEACTLKPEDVFSKDGYVLTGWNPKADGSGNMYAPGEQVAWKTDVLLYAQWTPARTLTFMPNNGFGGKGSVQTRGSGQKTVLPGQEVFESINGYAGWNGTLIGWNSQADGSGNTYAPGQEITWKNDVKLYAMWAPSTRTITYVIGSFQEHTRIHEAGKAVELLGNDNYARYGISFSKGAYTFAGWNSKADGSGNSYAAGRTVTWRENVTLYAQWKPNRMITYKANGGTGEDVAQFHGQGLKAALKPADTFMREGYTFIGWNSKADGSGNTYAAGQEVSWFNNVTLYAQWKLTRTITYKPNGTVGADAVQYHGQGIKTALYPEDTFRRTGYVFTGWNSKADGSGNFYEPGQQVTWKNDVTLYAQWIKK